MNDINTFEDKDLLHVRFDDIVLLISPQMLNTMLNHMIVAPQPYDFRHLGEMRAIKVDVDLTDVGPEKAAELLQFIKDDPL
jgi:hypothetical protein